MILVGWPNIHTLCHYVQCVDDGATPPEVTGISPSEGWVTGNEKIVLRGNNLGESKSDIIHIALAGSDCTSTVEYFSTGNVC